MTLYWLLATSNIGSRVTGGKGILRKLISVLLTIIGIAAVATAIGAELATSAGIGHFVISGGSCAIAVGVLLWCWS